MLAKICVLQQEREEQERKERKRRERKEQKRREMSVCMKTLAHSVKCSLVCQYLSLYLYILHKQYHYSYLVYTVNGSTEFLSNEILWWEYWSFSFHGDV